MDQPDAAPTSAQAPAHPEAGRLGIIGGGQLGMLLGGRARGLGVITTVLTPGTSDPAWHTADAVISAALGDSAAVARLIAASDVVTFELEAVPDATLDALVAAEARGEIAVRPSAASLALLKDKGLQKAWLCDRNLPTLPFVLTEADTDPESVLASGLPLPLVQKTRRGGYDGKGVQILRDRDALAALWPVAGLIEPALEAHREVSVVIARDCAGAMQAYPPVSMVFDDRFNAVEQVLLPASESPDILARCRSVAAAAVEALGSVGVFAVELFITPEDEVLINEISPRVHNSGHLTMDAFSHDQFEQQVRAVTGRPLAKPAPLAGAAIMFNLLYDDSYAAALSPVPYSLRLGRGDDAAVLHWYGKAVAKPGRKMGHINALGSSSAEARQRLDAALQCLRAGDIPGIEHYREASAP